MRHQPKIHYIKFSSALPLQFPLDRTPSGLFARMLLRNLELHYCHWNMDLGGSYEARPFLCAVAGPGDDQDFLRIGMPRNDRGEPRFPSGAARQVQGAGTPAGGYQGGTAPQAPDVRYREPDPDIRFADPGLVIRHTGPVPQSVSHEIRPACWKTVPAVPTDKECSMPDDAHYEMALAVAIRLLHALDARPLVLRHERLATAVYSVLDTLGGARNRRQWRFLPLSALPVRIQSRPARPCRPTPRRTRLRNPGEELKDGPKPSADGCPNACDGHPHRPPLPPRYPGVPAQRRMGGCRPGILPHLPGGVDRFPAAFIRPHRRETMSDTNANPGVDWRGANLRGVNMAGVSLRYADMRAATLQGATLPAAIWPMPIARANVQGAISKTPDFMERSCKASRPSKLIS